MTFPSNRPGRLGQLRILAASLLLAGACCTPGTRGPTGASTGAPLGKNLRCDVQVIYITADGKTYPKLAQIFPHQVVVWVADADALTIQWKAENPFPKLPQASGRFVYSIDMPTGKAGTYDYSGEIVRGGKHIVIDPRIEIMGMKTK